MLILKLKDMTINIYLIWPYKSRSLSTTCWGTTTTPGLDKRITVTVLYIIYPEMRDFSKCLLYFPYLVILLTSHNAPFPKDLNS